MANHYETRYQSDFIAKLHEHDGQCEEIVFYKGSQIHRAQFPSSNLGAASRGEYLRCMVASVARQDDVKALREHEEAISEIDSVRRERY